VEHHQRQAQQTPYPEAYLHRTFADELAAALRGEEETTP
jgi:hypothetical protein